MIEIKMTSRRFDEKEEMTIKQRKALSGLDIDCFIFSVDLKVYRSHTAMQLILANIFTWSAACESSLGYAPDFGLEINADPDLPDNQLRITQIPLTEWVKPGGILDGELLAEGKDGLFFNFYHLNKAVLEVWKLVKDNSGV